MKASQPPQASQREDVTIKPNARNDDKAVVPEGVGVGGLLCPWQRKGAKYDARKGPSTKDTMWHLVTLVRRLVVFSAALVYITRSIEATVATIHLLKATPLPTVDMEVYASPLIPQWAGTATIRQSPLVMLALQNATKPIANTIYLESATTTSLTGCSAVPTFSAGVYNNSFLRTIGGQLMAQTVYNLTLFATAEMIAPVVDCGLDERVLSTPTYLRAHFLIRHKNNTDDVSLLTLSLSMQDYAIPKQKQKGAAGVGTLQIIKDMAAPTVKSDYIVMQSYPYAAMKLQVYTMIGRTGDHDWRLLSIPTSNLLETPKEVVTARRRGLFINVETEQANYRSAYALTETTPYLALSRWRWQGGTVLRDSWSWVHCVHALFALDALINIVVLFLVIYRNLVMGKIWVGDAFVSVSNTLLHRGAIIILTWIVNDGWSLMEFCFANANHIAGHTEFYSEPAIFRADLLTLFLSIASIVGYVFRERIDPALVVYLFEISFSSRKQIGLGMASVKATLTQYAHDDLALGTLPMSPIVARTTPMRLGTIHALATKNVGFILLSFLPTFILLVAVVLFAIVRKVYRYYVPEKLHVLKVSNQSSGASGRSEDLQALKGNLTYFEVATGAALQRRVGVVSDYENCLYIKGMKYASADGIYCSGYVIANGKFLIATTDLVAILLMKIIRLRFKNLYVYEVDGSTVQQTARLVYPETIPWYDLLRLNISVLS